MPAKAFFGRFGGLFKVVFRTFDSEQGSWAREANLTISSLGQQSSIALNLMTVARFRTSAVDRQQSSTEQMTGNMLISLCPAGINSKGTCTSTETKATF
jgi:hypothetical protein